MRALCGIRSVKGVNRLTLYSWIFSTVGYFLGSWLINNKSIKDPEVISYALGLSAGHVCALFVLPRIRKLTKCLSFCFPVSCGHRKCVFTGRSSKNLREILLSVDEKIPTEQQVQEFTYDASVYSDDVKSALERTTGTIFQYFFSGSVVERFGIPLMMARQPGCCGKPLCCIDALNTDLDIMFFPVGDKASLSGEENIVVEPRVTQSEGFTGYAQLTSLTLGLFVQNSTWLVSSKLARNTARDAVEETPVDNLPGAPCCCGMCEDTPKTRLFSKGPTMKLHLGHFFEADITPCIQCTDWPALSDWPSRPRYWPSVDEAQRIMSLGCHLVAKPAPNDKEETSWRFSFSLSEVELSKLVPNTARKCFLALKIIFKDHLQPVMPALSSYHMKSIFFNTLEKVPVGFWVEANIEECFRTLLAELRDALVSMNCPHYWFSYINLFETQVACCGIEVKRLQILAEKVQIILNDPAPFIFDDGCCCLSPCCFSAPHYNFTRRTSEQFLVDYEEVVLSADGHVIPRAQHRVGSGNKPCQPSVPPSLRCEAQLDPCFYSLRGNYSDKITEEPDQVVASVHHMHEQGPSICPGEAKERASFCSFEAHGHAITETRHAVDPRNHRDKLPVSSSPRCEARLSSSFSSSGDFNQEVITEPKQSVVSLPIVHDAEQELSVCSSEAEDDSLSDSLPILVSSPFSGWLARLQQFYKVA